MRGHKEINWKTAKGMMSEANFLRSLMEMDCDSISASQVKTVRGEIHSEWFSLSKKFLIALTKVTEVLRRKLQE